jgi:hypothetical protein
LTSCLTGLSVLKIKTKIVSCHTADSKPVKQEVHGTVVLPPLVFPALAYHNIRTFHTLTLFCPKRPMKNSLITLTTDTLKRLTSKHCSCHPAEEIFPPPAPLPPLPPSAQDSDVANDDDIDPPAGLGFKNIQPEFFATSCGYQVTIFENVLQGILAEGEGSVLLTSLF